jgi:hypothetical protein
MNALRTWVVEPIIDPYIQTMRAFVDGCGWYAGTVAADFRNLQRWRDRRHKLDFEMSVASFKRMSESLAADMAKTQEMLEAPYLSKYTQSLVHRKKTALEETPGMTFWNNSVDDIIDSPRREIGIRTPVNPFLRPSMYRSRDEK